MIPAEPGEARRPSSPRSLPEALAGELACNPADGRTDGGRREQRRREEADDEADPAADLHPLAAEMVARLLNVCLAFGVLDDERNAVGDDLPSPARLAYASKSSCARSGMRYTATSTSSCPFFLVTMLLRRVIYALAACVASACSACSFNVLASSSLMCGAMSKATCLILPVKANGALSA